MISARGKAPETLAGRREMFFLLLPTLECNLRCEYCFEKHEPGRWSVDTSCEIVSKILGYLQEAGIGKCRFHWQGGEPLLLGPEYWKSVLGFSEKLAKQKNIRLSQSMQTNLTRYSHQYAPLVHRYLNGVLGSSFEIASARRMINGDSEIFKSRWRAAYQKARGDGLTVGVLSLINQWALDTGAASYLDTMRNDYGIDKLRFTLPFQQVEGSGYWIDPVSAGNFLADAYVYWLENGGNGWMEIRPFEYLRARISGNNSRESGLCMFANNCTDIAMTVMTSGEVSLCDNFVHPGCDVRFGNIFQESMDTIINSQARSRIRRRISALVDEQCTSCRYLGYCFGGCLVRSRLLPGKGGYRDHYCQSYKRLFEAIEMSIDGDAAGKPANTKETCDSTIRSVLLD